MDFYSRVATASLKKESVNNTAVIPDVFFGFNEEDIAAEYSFTPTMAVVGNRSKNIQSVISPINAPEGTISMYVEPNTFGHFMNGLSPITSGRVILTSGGSGTFTVGETVTGGSSSATGTVNFVGDNYVLVTSPSGTFTTGETITGGSSSATATVDLYNSTIYGHAADIPQTVTSTYTVQFNFPEHAIRYIGTRFTALDSLAQEENIIVAGVKIMAQSQFRHALVTAITTSGSGAKTITVDQTQGLVAGDSIKIWRPGTGFIDFASAGVKTHTIGTVPTALTLTVTNLETSLAVGDILVLAPQVATYDVAGEFPWIGGASVEMGPTLASLIEECIEEFNLIVNNEYEARHCALGNNVADRFPQHIIQKSLEITGTFTTKYENEEYYKYLRSNTPLAVRFRTRAKNINSTSIPYEFRLSFPSTRIDAYQTNIGQDDVVNEEMPFTAFYDFGSNCMARMLLINDVTSY